MSENVLVKMVLNFLVLLVLSNPHNTVSAWFGSGYCIKAGFTLESPYWDKSPYYEACLRGTEEFLCKNKYEDTQIMQCTRYAWCEQGVQTFGDCNSDEWFDSCEGKPLLD